jgi:hypothetical protein
MRGARVASLERADPQLAGAGPISGRTHQSPQVYRLMKAGVARRVLFLVDRRALAAQAVRAFSAFEVEPGLKFDQAYEGST